MSRTSSERQVPIQKARRREKPRQTRHAQFVAEVLRNGGNASAAARAVGYHPDHGRRLVSRSATVIAALEEAQNQAEEEIREWIELAPEAQSVLLDLLDSENDRVRFQAAVYILDRALGKIPQQVETKMTHQSALSEIEMLAALSLVHGRGLTFSDATSYVRGHPDEVKAWAKTQMF